MADLAPKDKILLLLAEKPAQTWSGEALAGELGISRAGVWKHIKKLQTEGFRIEAIAGQGYRLARGSKNIFAAGIQAELAEDQANYRLEVLDSCPSTNDLAKASLAHNDQPDDKPLFIIANEQSQGRGRHGKSFASPAGNGIYLSLAFRPKKLRADQAQLVTCAAAVLACRAISRTCGFEAQIKWVNDLYYKDLKLAGILTEAVSDFESMTVNSLVVGIGINIRRDLLPVELQASATGLLDCMPPPAIDGFSENKLVANLMRELGKLGEILDSSNFQNTILEEYRSRSCLTGRTICFYQSGEKKQAKALAIDEKGGLVILQPDGNQSTLYSGQVELIRPIAQL